MSSAVIPMPEHQWLDTGMWSKMKSSTNIGTNKYSKEKSLPQHNSRRECVRSVELTSWLPSVLYVSTMWRKRELHWWLRSISNCAAVLKFPEECPPFTFSTVYFSDRLLASFWLFVNAADDHIIDIRYNNNTKSRSIISSNNHISWIKAIEYTCNPAFHILIMQIRPNKCSCSKRQINIIISHKSQQSKAQIFSLHIYL